MTVNEINFAMINREKVVMPRGSAVIMRPMEIRGLTKVRRSKFEEERGADGFYFEVQLIDATGRGWINAVPEQLDPAEPEKFASMWARFKEIQERRKEVDSHGV